MKQTGQAYALVFSIIAAGGLWIYGVTNWIWLIAVGFLVYKAVETNFEEEPKPETNEDLPDPKYITRIPADREKPTAPIPYITAGQPVPAGQAADNSQLLGFLGAGLLFLGVFVPILRLPFIGSVNYFQNGQGDGVIVLLCAIISAVLVLLRRYQGLWLTALLSGGTMAFTLVNFFAKLHEMKAEMDRELSGNPFRGLADMAVQSIQLEWGWGLLIAGVVLLLVVANNNIGKSPHAITS